MFNYRDENYNNQDLQINKYQFILMQEAELAIAATKSRWQGAESLRKELSHLITLTDLPEIPTPSGLQASLRDYQQYGLNWLQFLRVSKFSGVLADDMGLGKTYQTIVAALESGCKKILIICPASVKLNWKKELLN